MTGRFSVPLRVAAVSATTAVLGAMAAFPAAAADNGGVQVVNTETVQVYTDATGSIDTKRIYEQLALTGKGSVKLHNPIETDGLRNLDGFGGFEVKGGQQIANLTVDGEQRLRSVSDYTGKLPLDVKVRYFLNGEAVEPGDVVGKDGKLEVKYTVKNVTGVQQEVTFDDGKGGTVTKSVEVPIPMVGSLTTVAPPNFTDVASSQANMAGDGKGGTKLSFTMTLFPPIGSDTAEFGYTANISDGVVPRATISALPVNPLESPSFKGAGASYKGGADTGVELTDGATQIDENLLKLRDGAGQLLAGLIQLRDGAAKLDAGLSGVAAPGAKRLASGAGELAGGLGKIDDGAGKLADGADRLSAGAGQLSAGTGAASDGAVKLRNGARRLDNGVGDLASGAAKIDGYMAALSEGQATLLGGIQLLEAGVKDLPASVDQNLQSNQQYQALLSGMLSTVYAVGNPDMLTNPETGKPTLYAGIKGVRDGLTVLIVPGVDKMLAGIPESWARLDCASSILTDLTSANAADNAPDKCFPASLGSARPGSLEDLSNPLTVAILHGMATQLAAGRDSLSDDPANPNPSLDTLNGGLLRVKGGIEKQIVPPLNTMLASIYNSDANANCAIGKATPAATDDCGLQQAVGFFRASIPVLVDGITTSVSQTLLQSISAPTSGCTSKTRTLVCGATALAEGGSALGDGTGQLVVGVGRLGDGSSLLAGKLGELAGGMAKIDEGAGKLRDGSGKLADGAGQLADGTGKAADGSGQLADGANKLATGLGDAADGSGKIADGLRKAADGAPKLRDGAQRLSDEGTSKLVEAGKSTAQNYGEMYAVIEAGAQRAQTEKMVYGAPEDAVGLAAYSYELKGEDGEGSRNMTRGLGGLAVLAAGAGAFALRRRVI